MASISTIRLYVVTKHPVVKKCSERKAGADAQITQKTHECLLRFQFYLKWESLYQIPSLGGNNWMRAQEISSRYINLNMEKFGDESNLKNSEL